MDLFVVDDDPGVLALAARVLAGPGVRVHSFADAATALVALERIGSVSAIVSDVAMPGRMDGRTLAATVAARRPDVPVVLMSADDGALAAARGRPGVSGLVTKPFTATGLRVAVRSAIEKHGMALPDGEESDGAAVSEAIVPGAVALREACSTGRP